MSVEMKRRLFTVQEYHLMSEAGVFSDRERVELIEGEIIQMAAIGKRHAARVDRLARMFSRIPESLVIFRVQNPICLNDNSEPQPDIALVQPRADFYEESLPNSEDVLLLVEVADSTVNYDRDVKVPNYARSGIQEVWLWDLEANCLEVYRNPTANGYSLIQNFERGQEFSPLAFPDFAVSVDLILG
ncbi:MAG: Uma2 family endonuclease [Microcoleus sp. PH2017_10_PVI_O_A]|uniref:Uma2 family endonuclease n=1 Tax=unclassified Microcoleus TaxID=2642155 RepID=UPI001D786787|nr:MULTISPECIES: Uma2 family endonuclease [unclassified Microcoleus]TAE75662.1 MAG: Uma2 family endonuclease [Oscillatoriales cyanobacterium]MCC3409436.1 Uma2 family endonuclease [Microcoleus sp. PH2017_10_PVI_O_A]MCC3463689.1 Uma2 family endonuclease [Microcoleus sp. PH2017_11_PCY_U_A]MCC3482052.1 Uma2 family endonuclease [Microcoleus sp. PH2017_12_PCY_D_A]MCC3531923.1 Uma2 family endonuclease [Microcoleus sp. PH2017_21_RUC_O_A]